MFMKRVTREAYNTLVGQPGGKRPFGRPRRRCDNTKMDLREKGFGNVNLIHHRIHESDTGPYPEPVKSTPYPPANLRSILIPSSHLRAGVPSGLFPSGFPTKTLYAFLSSPTRATFPNHLNLLGSIRLISRDLIYTRIAQNKVRRGALVNALLTLRVLRKSRNFLTR
jgi:hypothetical protein